MTIGEAFRLCREEAGLTQTEAARRMGLSQAGVSTIELGYSDPSFATLRAAAGVYPRDPYLVFAAGARLAAVGGPPP